MIIIFFSFSGNGLLAGLSMKRPSVYIDQWTEENAQWHPLENNNNNNNLFIRAQQIARIRLSIN